MLTLELFEFEDIAHFLLVTMVKLRVIPRTAAFAWSPDASSKFLATGTRAGAIDADFSNVTRLELWDLDLDNECQSHQLEPVANIDTDSR